MSYSRFSPVQLQSFLKQVPLFAGLDDGQLEALARVCYVKRVQRGHIVFRRGDPSNAVYILWSGSIAEFAGGPNELEIIVKVRHKNDYFGEVGMLIDEPQMVTAIARQSSLLVVIPRHEFLMRVWSELEIMKYLIRTLINRLKDAGECQVTYAFLDSPARLACFVLRLEQEEGGNSFITVTQDYLAQCCGFTRQTVARILRKWRNAGWIVTSYQRIEIVNRAALIDIILESE